jgi:hypothetical protein
VLKFKNKFGSLRVNMFSGIFLNLFLHKPKLLEDNNLLLKYKLGFPAIVPFQ